MSDTDRIMKIVGEIKEMTNLPFGKILSISIKDVTSYLGMCSKTADGFNLTFSTYILGNEELLKNTIAHELVHTIKGCYNHGDLFKATGKSLERYGFQGVDERVSDAEEMEIAKKNKAKYVLSCVKCGKQWYRQKKSKMVTQPWNYGCKCGGMLKVSDV